MKIRFSRDYQVKAVNGPFYKEGEIYDLPEASARHFVRRGAAVEVDKRPAPEPAPKKKKGPFKATPAGKPERELGGDKDPNQAFTEGQRQYRQAELEPVEKPD